MKELTIVVPAESSVPVNASGTFLRVNSTSGVLKYKFKNNSVSPGANEAVRFTEKFESLEVYNETAAEVTAVIVVGDGDYKGAAELSGSFSTAVASDFKSFPDLSVPAGESLAVAVANGVRACFWLSNLSSNAASFRVGDSAVAASQGSELMPGQSVFLETTDAIYFYNTGAAAQSVGRTEVNK